MNKKVKAPLDKLSQLRALMKQRKLDGYLLPLTDEFQNEYVPPHFQRLEWLTGFTGSNAFVVVLAERAAFFTDGRYTIQAKEEVNAEQFERFDMAETAPSNWLKNIVKNKSRIGYDAACMTFRQLEPFETALKGKASFIELPNLVDSLWKNRPAKPSGEMLVHPLKYAGMGVEEKIALIAQELKNAECASVYISAPESVCWLFNIRGSDVPCTPIVLARAMVHANGNAELITFGKKPSAEVKAHLKNHVKIIDAVEFSKSFKKFKNKHVWIDPNTTSVLDATRFKKSGAKIVEGADPCMAPKACKNNVEIEGARAAHVRDGAAMVKFLYWLHGNALRLNVTEMAAAEQLEKFRALDKQFKGISFPTIAAVDEHAAIVHYRPKASSNKAMTLGSLVLIDSGAQYLDGTTDVTRTITIGSPKKEYQDRFTRVLKGHIAIATAKFPHGVSGHDLDILARHPLWQQGLDYAHGTGHGVGSYLSVHEGPQRISRSPSSVSLKPGMILSNEPGYYKEGSYGIRIENLIVVTEFEDFHSTGKNFLGFETLTLVPIDLKLVDRTLLSAQERQWLNEYHRQVRNKVEPFLTPQEASWLVEQTVPI